MKTKQNRLLVISVAVCAIAVLGMVLALTLGRQDKTAAFIPPQFDERAQNGTPTVAEEMGWSELDTQAFKASVCGVFVPDSGKADVYLTNPESNTVWLKLRVLDSEGNVLGETGLIRPGEYVQSVSLNTVPKSGEAITLKLMAYEPETYHSAGAVSLNTVVR